jgi:hypothetical protein
MHTAVLLPTSTNSVHVDNIATTLNTAFMGRPGRGSKLVQFTVNCSIEMQIFVIQYIRIHNNMLYQIVGHFIMINPIKIP